MLDKDQSIDVGRLSFRTGHRAFGGDGGPALMLFAENSQNEWREIARYDCFVKEPHRHIFHADGRDDRASLGTTSLEESLCVAMDEARKRLPRILEVSGNGDLSGESSAEIERALDEVERRLRSIEA